MAKINGLEGLSGQQLSEELRKGGKFVIFPFCVSIIILTFRRSSAVYFVKAGESVVVKSLPFVLLSLVAGWWGIPWGPIYTIGSVVTNLQGGKNVTNEVLASLRRPSG